MVTQTELEALLAAGNEIRSFEVKGPGSPGGLGDKAYVARIARAAMAMGNHRDGGLVVLGIDDKQMGAMVPGLGPTQLNEWSDYDNVSSALAKYSDPPVTLALHRFTLSSGAEVVVLEVSQFEHVPHVCKRNFPDVLQDGATYVRSLRKPESVPIPSSVEGRELLDLATDKGVREFVARAAAAGLLPGALTPPSQAQVGEAAFNAEAEQGWTP
ncbi:hypothetical protein EUA06_21485 [Nocardioides glacieisoli]|uniref:Schlafen AlbA-2 domain-containing protein n=1 Tax=Nocardioides glacieisoli TaxID=1168730 RepID=A0A4Q2RHZ1_9ACTN|nr:RNA-binding domain-containing protein [Nocardioides glacieisoli]RYB88331.1 hypothetical protein EUA06_21485 [Nocardioides glacieisoli]